MTVAEMIALRTAKLEAIKDSSNAAVTARGGTAAGDLSGLPDAIASIPSGGELPELTTPAEVGHVLAGKEYIDGNGDKKSGTLVVCDTVYEVETLPYPGTGLTVELESSADGSNKTMTLPEPNLAAENIVQGKSIFGVSGTAKTVEILTADITPVKDVATLTIPIPNATAVRVVLDSDDILSLAGSKSFYSSVSSVIGAAPNAIAGAVYYAEGATSQKYSAVIARKDSTRTRITTEIDPSGAVFAAGVTYHCTVYQWVEA